MTSPLRLEAGPQFPVPNDVRLLQPGEVIASGDLAVNKRGSWPERIGTSAAGAKVRASDGCWYFRRVEEGKREEGSVEGSLKLTPEENTVPPSAGAEVPTVPADLLMCTGCGHDKRIPIGPPHLACCPDSRYRTVSEILRKASEGATRGLIEVDWVVDLLSKAFHRAAPQAPAPAPRDAVLIGRLLYLIDRILDAKTSEQTKIIHEIRTDDEIRSALQRWRQAPASPGVVDSTDQGGK